MPADPPPSTAGPRPAAAPRSMLALGATLGAGAWWCDQVFSIAGRWVPDTPEASVRGHLAELSRVVGDHGVALRRHLPRPTGTDPEWWVTPPSGSARNVVGLVADSEGSARRLAALHRVLVPRLLVVWDVQRRSTAPADRGVARTVGHACIDVEELWREGEGLIQALVDTDPGCVDAVHAAARDVEVALVTAGGIVGPVPAHPPTDGAGDPAS